MVNDSYFQFDEDNKTKYTFSRSSNTFWNINGLVQDSGISIASAMEIPESCTKPLMHNPNRLFGVFKFNLALPVENLPTHSAGYTVTRHDDLKQKIQIQHNQCADSESWLVQFLDC